MIIDSLLQFSAAQVVTATAPSTNSLDLSVARHGVGEELYIFASLAAPMVGAGAIIAVTAEFADDAAFTTNVESFSIGTFTAVSAAGAKVFQHLPITKLKQRYLQLKYTVSGGTLTASSINAAIVKDVDAYESYADAFTIS